MQLEEAKKGNATPEMEAVAQEEDIPINQLIERITSGRIVIPSNVERDEVKPTGIGEGLRVKINANVGTSPDYADVEEEVEKAKIAEKYGADTVMDLSIGGDIDEVRRRILEAVKAPIGTVPIYQAGIKAAEEGNVVDMSSDDIFNGIRKHAEDGVDFVTIHCGVTRKAVEALKERRRLLGVVSRGGSFLAAWILHHGEENPLYKEYDYLLEIAQEYDLTLSLGDGLRPGCLADASDHAQFQELLTIGELTERAQAKNVQVIVEGPGHLPLDHIEANVKLEKSICKGAPFYVLGPIVTDIAPGYDHLVGAIGGALAARAGTDFLCYVTPSEHLCLPNIDDVKEGVIASKIAAHAADVARGINTELDDKMAEARRDFNWGKQSELAVDKEKALRMREERPAQVDPETCSMCSDFCALKMVRDYLEGE
ncbi:phosphomethylpyrimidine synthase [candidate division MSBL1 archaeon SCGC-AAA261O19]|uniref:Phosphomethylpyrimidine synthase n=1 Tax=candidate division MSBL1 archaeon SCGC-AAA261O19 TaxID=1698277 RepID=A0A133V9X4_9EURY|nr:phosphomethylpyrimidine synthase [candidate division MSBL1 archaeon SCGC-AAA261O19]